MEENKYCYKYPHPAVTTDCVIFGFDGERLQVLLVDRKSTRLNSSHMSESRMPSSA